MYGNFAGRDASRGMAKQSFDLGECSCCAVSSFEVSLSDMCVEMLTPVDQPLDKLEDLKPEEMYVHSYPGWQMLIILSPI